jgi:CubicO group peptidase (beta-lactamase class C family)
VPNWDAGEGWVPAKYAEVDALLEAAVAEGRAAGVSVLVVKEGSVDFVRAYGEAELGSGRALRTDSIVRIHSMTKAVTSVAAMMLWEEGRLRLDDPVERYLPEWAAAEVGQYSLLGHRVVRLERTMTIRDLLRHTSGIPYHGWLPAPYPELLAAEFPVDDKPESLAEFSERLARVPLLHQPGVMWTYGAGTDVLGRVIEVASGVAFEEFLEERILAPLGMVDTGFYVPEEKWGRFVAEHSVGEDGLVDGVREGSWDRYRVAPLSPSGGGGLVSTLEDYAVFLQMLLEGGEWEGVRYLRESTVARMTSPASAAGAPHPPFNLFGLGFEIIAEENESSGWGRAGAYSWSGMARTHFLVDPARKLVLLLFQQTVPFDVGSRNEIFGALHRANGWAVEADSVGEALVGDA